MSETLEFRKMSITIFTVICFLPKKTKIERHDHDRVLPLLPFRPTSGSEKLLKYAQAYSLSVSTPGLSLKIKHDFSAKFFRDAFT